LATRTRLQREYGLITRAIPPSGVSIRTSFLPVLIALKILHRSEPRRRDMVRCAVLASEGLAHHFAVEE
jgi:hypothetical protein